MTWTPERLATLTRMWSDGYSAGLVAKALGAGITRSAVIGKAHRLGLYRSIEIGHQARVAGGRASHTGSPGRPKADRPPVVRKRVSPTVHHIGQARPPRLRDRHTFTTPPPADAPPSLGLTVLQIRTFGQCKYGTHEEGGEHRFCGQPVAEGSVYCAFHHVRCYAGAPSAEAKQRRAA